MNYFRSTFPIPEWNLINLPDIHLSSSYSEEQINNFKNFLFVYHLAYKILKEQTNVITLSPYAKCLEKDAKLWQNNCNLTCDWFVSACVKWYSMNDFFFWGGLKTWTECSDKNLTYTNLLEDYGVKFQDELDFLFEYESGSGDTRIRFSRQNYRLDISIESNENNYSNWTTYSGLWFFQAYFDQLEFNHEDYSLFLFEIEEYCEINAFELDRALSQYMENLRQWRIENQIFGE